MKTTNPDTKTIASLLAALVLTACGDEDGPSPIGEFDDETACLYADDGLADLQPSEGTDYVALRVKEDYGQPPEQVVVNIVADWGTACDGAADQAACTDDVANLGVDTPLFTRSGQITSIYDVLFTDADGAGVTTTRQQLLDLLGPIDSASEAGLVAFVDGHDVRCGRPNVREEGDDLVLLGVRGSGCGQGDNIYQFEITVTPAGDVSTGEEELVERGDPNCAVGRRPETLCTQAPTVSDVGEFFANVAHLEAAAVPAFAQLAKELLAHGAPKELVARAVAGVKDEVRHTKAMRRLARRFGAEVVPPTVGLDDNRTLFEMALDNAAEGCVRETFGALIATVQSKRATDPDVRAELARIAADETGHAEMSWEIDRWVRTRLSDAEIARLDDAKREAAATLERDVAYDWPESVVAIAGMPDAAESATLAAAFRSELAL